MLDATWIGVAPTVLAPHVADPANWRSWWPDLDLEVDELRGAKGVRWLVPHGRRGTVSGSMELYLQPIDDGTVVHFFLRLDGTRGPINRRAGSRLEREYRSRVKHALWQLSDRVDPGRLARVAGPSDRVP